MTRLYTAEKSHLAREVFTLAEKRRCEWKKDYRYMYVYIYMCIWWPWWCPPLSGEGISLAWWIEPFESCVYARRECRYTRVYISVYIAYTSMRQRESEWGFWSDGRKCSFSLYIRPAPGRSHAFSQSAQVAAVTHRLLPRSSSLFFLRFRIDALDRIASWSATSHWRLFYAWPRRPSLNYVSLIFFFF